MEFKTDYRLMQVKNIAEKEIILQYFLPPSSYPLLLRSLFCLFLNGQFTQGFLYVLFSHDLAQIKSAQINLAQIVLIKL